MAPRGGAWQSSPRSSASATWMVRGLAASLPACLPGRCTAAAWWCRGTHAGNLAGLLLPSSATLESCLPACIDAGMGGPNCEEPFEQV